jgi:hypothetical protein
VEEGEERKKEKKKERSREVYMSKTDTDKIWRGGVVGSVGCV